MKRLLKLCVVAVVLVLGVSSCLKEDDSLQSSVITAYILQSENEKFIPQMRLVSYDGLLESASLSIEGKKISFDKLADMNVWELPSSSYFGGGILEFDSIASAGLVNLVGINGQIETRQVGNFLATKKMGDISSSLKYSSSKNELNVTLNALVKDAESYYLMYNTPSSGSSTMMWMPLLELKKIKGTVLSEDVSFEGLLGKYEFALAAVYGGVIKIDKLNKALVEIKEQ